MKNNIYLNKLNITQKTNKVLELRILFFIFLYQKSMPIYRIFIKRKRPAWKVTLEQLQQYPDNTLGFHYAQFINENNFDPMANFENHDAMHILLDYSTEMESESAMQFCLLGNGKRSFYLFSMVFMSCIFFPEHLRKFHQAYRRGKTLNQFYDWDFEKLLCTPVTKIKNSLTEPTDSPILFI